MERTRLAGVRALVALRLEVLNLEMAGQANTDLFQQATDLFAQRVDEYATGIAQRLGTPMSGSQLTHEQVLQRWNYTPLGDAQTADAHYHQLVASGMPPGQALDAVYPFRKMLFTGPDLKSQINTAKQIAGWNSDATGAPPPESDPSKLPYLHWAGTMSGGPPTGQLPAAPTQPGLPGPAIPQAAGGGASIPPPPAVPGAGGINPGAISPVPGQMPPVTPVPGVS